MNAGMFTWDRNLVPEHGAACRALLVSTEMDVASQYLFTVSGASGAKAMADLGDHKMEAEVFSPGAANLAKADATILLFRNLDHESLRTANRLLAEVPAESRDVQVVVFLRESGARQYKINCSCGQKLLVADAEIGRKGLCPACNTKFVIPSPEEWLRQRGVIDQLTPCFSATIGHRPLCKAPLVHVMNVVTARETAQKAQTMRIAMPASDTQA